MELILLLLWIMTASSISHAKDENHATFNASSTLPEPTTAQHHFNSRVRRRINPATFSAATCQQTCFSTFHFQTFFLRRRGFFARSRLLASVNLNNCRRRCLGINECETGAADCAPDATCFDTPGSFECRCNEGFEGDGRTGCTPAMLGTADNPAVSCAAILSANPSAESGQYFLRSANAGPSDPSTSVFCDMTLDCDGLVGGWRQIADIDSNTGCPEGFFQATISPPGQPVSTFCTPVSAVGPGCLVSLSFPVNSIEYGQVCGRVIGFHNPTNDITGFGSLTGGTGTLDGLYVEGISLTYGSSPRTHIWTFVATNVRVDPTNNICPCVSASAPQPPGFVGNNYFCDSTRFPFWDGNECSGSDMCSCTEEQGNGPPFFLRTFDTPVAEDIEMRLCTDNAFETVEFFLVELYVR